MGTDLVEQAYKFLVEKNRPEKALEILQKLDHPENFPEALMILTHANRLLSHFDEAEYFAKLLMQYPEWQPHAQWSLGSINARMGNLETALDLLNKAKDGLTGTRYYPSVLLDIGTTNWLMGNEDEAYKVLTTSAKYAKKLGNFPLLSAILGNLSVITWNLDKYRESFEYAHNSLEIAKRYGWKHSMCHILSNLLVHYGDVNDIKMSRKMFEDALRENCDAIPDVKIHLYMGYALSEIRAGNISAALNSLAKIENDALVIEDRRLAAEFYMLKASISFKLKNYRKALDELEKVTERWDVEGAGVQESALLLKNLTLARLGRKHDEISPDSVVLADSNYYLPIVIKYFYDKGDFENSLRLCKIMAEERNIFMGDLLMFWDEIEPLIPECLEEADTELLKFFLTTGKEHIVEELLSKIEPEKLIEILPDIDFPPQTFSLIINRIPESYKNQRDEIREIYKVSHSIRINTLGNFELWIGDHKIPDTGWRRPFALDVLKFFVTLRNRWLERDYIYESLWPEESPESSASKLRVYLNYIRKTIEPWKLKNEKSDLIVWKGGSYGFFTGQTIFVDADEFEEISKRGIELYNRGKEDEAISVIEKALDIYRGPYMVDERYKSWIEMERVRLRKLYLTAVKNLSNILLKMNAFDRADYHLYRAFLEDATDETIVEIYLNLLISVGRSNQAVKIFRLYEEQLAKKYELSPSSKIRKIIDSIGTQNPT